MRKLLTLLVVVLLCGIAAIAQIHAVTGKVTDDKGNPIEGASITIKGSRVGTAADSRGNFKINAKDGDLLIISSTGFSSKEIKVSGNSVSVSLAQGTNVIDEVVVTALGLKRTKNSLPYATQQVSAEDLNRTPTTNFVDNLSGKVAGLTITSSNTMGGSTNAILRGFKSLTGSNQALFVVDGIPYDNTNYSRANFDLGNAASDINPDDIESINVLKGAAASALYGSRGSNGVILISTKKGNKRKGLGVNVNLGATVGTFDKSTLPTYQTQYGQGYGSGGYSSAFPAESGFFYYRPIFNSAGQRVRIVQTDQDAGTGPAYDPSLLVYNWDAFNPAHPNYGKATPWAPSSHYNPTDYFETPTSTTAGVSVDGGNERGSFRLGYTRNDEKGYLPNAKLTKDLLTFTGSHNITDKLVASASLNYSGVTGLGRYGYNYSNSGNNPMTDFRQWWPTNVDLLQQKDLYFSTHTNATWNVAPANYLNPMSAKPSYHNNPWWDRYENYESDSRTRYFGNVALNYKLTSYLSVMGRVSLDNYTELTETRTNVGSQQTSAYTRRNDQFGETNYDLMINFDKNVTKDINVKALLGGNIRKNHTQSIAASSNGGIVVPGLWALSNSVKTPTAPTESDVRKEVDAIFGGATFTYKEMVTVDATLRSDHSSTLPKSNNTYYYPSVSGNFVFSKVLPGLTWLSYGKVRANYAEVGTDAGAFALQNVYNAQTAFNGQTLFSQGTTNNNPNLKPERSKSYEFGIEASFFNRRLGFDVTYYHTQQIDQIMPTTVSRTSGYSTFQVNGGTVQNQGWEISLNANPVKLKDFSWNINLNWATNKNKVISLYNNQPAYTITSWQNSVQLVAVAGGSWGTIRGKDYTYLNGQRIVDATGHYILNSNTLSDIGNINPNWWGGVTNSFAYKNLALSFLIDVKNGGSVYSLDMDYGSGSGLYPRTAGYNDLGKPVRSTLANGGGIILDGVTADGKKNTVRVDESDINNALYTFSTANGEAHKEFVYDASYVKLREVAITYSFPKSITDKIGFIRGLALSLTGRNLWIIHKNLPYADPEQGSASGNASIGFQSGAYPTVRNFGLNLKANF